MLRYCVYAIFSLIFIFSINIIGITIYVYAQENTLSTRNTTYGHSASGVCSALIKIAEQKRLLPLQLLLAVAYVESTKKSTSMPWPWTVNLAGNSKYFMTKIEAINFVKNQLNEGKTNIDIGCMQINYKYHSKAFDSVAEMFDPLHNVAYATTFLLSLYERFGTWSDAIRYYHSSVPDKHLKYQESVMKAWDKISTVSNNTKITNKPIEDIESKIKLKLTVEDQAIQDLILDTQEKFQLELLDLP